jgi:O-antigen/teichoic acid export membrane protein
LLVPVSLRCLTTSEYGIWLTLTSITVWFVSLDFGLGNGLRNKLAEAFAENNLELGKAYTSTAYAYLLLFFGILYFIFLIIHPHLNWMKILNASPELSDTLPTLVFVVFSLFFLNFILKLVITIPLADQRPAVNGLLNLFNNLLTVGAIYLLSKTDHASLLNLGIISSIMPALIYSLASIIFFTGRYKQIRPSLKHIKSEYSQKLLTLGFRFFIIQIAGFIIFTTDNLIITQIFTPADVTIYNIAFKYFNTLILVFGVILTPFWSAYTEAYAKKEFDWIKRVMNQLIRIWIMFVGLIILILLVSPVAYRLWVGSEIQIPQTLSILMAIFAIITMWNNIYIYFLNGVGKIQLQLYTAVIMGILNIPLSIIFAKNLNLGVSGVILATAVSLSPSAIWSPIQYWKIVNQKAHGIWNK